MQEEMGITQWLICLRRTLLGYTKNDAPGCAHVSHPYYCYKYIARAVVTEIGHLPLAIQTTMNVPLVVPVMRVCRRPDAFDCEQTTPKTHLPE